MAVELLIKNEKTGASELIPIATSQVFREYWRVGSAALNLRLVLLLEDGLFKKEDIPDLIGELRRLRNWFETSQPNSISNALTARADTAIAAFERVLESPDFTLG
jgi:hypothetical protein